MGYLDRDGLSRAFTKLKTLIDKKQDKMKQIGLPSSTTTYKNKWVKFATVDLSSSAAWVGCSGTLSLTQGEGGNALGTLKFYFRNGGTAGVITSTSLTWVSLSDSKYANSVANVKVANGKYDIYYKPVGDYETPWFALLDCTAYNSFVFNNGSYVDSINASYTSVVSSYASSAGSVSWGNVSGKPSTFTPSSHTHDDRYYTETEMDSKLSGKANSSHTHTKSQITDFPSSMKNPNSLTISLNGTSQGAYDGSAAKSINVTPSSIGAATSGHTHNYAGSSSAGGAATKANGIVVSDTRNYNSAPNDAAFDKNMLTADFKYGSKIGSPTGFNGTYCGVLSLAPWSETSGGHGYQLAFGYEKEGHPRLALRGSDLSATSWDSWYKVYTSDDKPTLSELGAAAASHTHTKSQVGLGNVDNTADAAKSVKYATTAGSANSVAWSNVSGKPTSMPASDVYSWAKASSKPSYSASEVGAVPTSRTVNGKALSSNITLSAGDVGAAASSHSHNYAGSTSAGGNATWANGATYSQYTFCDKQTVTSGSGSAYTATVSGLSLVAGNSFVMVPHTTSTTTAPTLNVNGLGAKNIRMRLSSNTSSTIQLIRSDFLVANKPVRVVYDGTYWVLDDFVQPDANCLYGTLISRGTSAPSNSTGGFIYIQTT